MPFTFSHPAFVWPVAKIKPQFFSYTGLFFGSIAPDCHMYLTFSVYPIIENNIFGIFTLYMPLAVVMSMVFHLLVRNILIMHLPQPFDVRYAGILSFNFLGYLKKKYGVFLLSVFIGVVVHLALDNLSHQTTTFSKAYPDTISSEISVTSSLTVKIYFLLQVLFSVFGLAYIALYALTYNNPLPVYRPIAKHKKRMYYYLLFVVFTAIVTIRFLLPWDASWFIDLVMITLMSAAMLSVVVVSAIIFAKNRLVKT